MNTNTHKYQCLHANGQQFCMRRSFKWLDFEENTNLKEEHKKGNSSHNGQIKMAVGKRSRGYKIAMSTNFTKL